MRRIAVVLALSGCATRAVVVSPGIVAHSAAELRQHGQVVVYTMDGKQSTIHAKDRVDVYVRDGDLQHRVSLTLAEVAAGCELETGGSCVAEHVVDQRIVVRHEHGVDSDLVAKAVGFAAIAGLTGYCLAECQDDGSVARGYGYAAAGVAAVGLIFALFLLGGHD